MKTPDECKKILFTVGIKLGVSPKLISTRLLNDLDKSDMNGKTESYQEEKNRLAREAKREVETKAVCNKPFINYRCMD